MDLFVNLDIALKIYLLHVFKRYLLTPAVHVSENTRDGRKTPNQRNTITPPMFVLDMIEIIFSSNVNSPAFMFFIGEKKKCKTCITECKRLSFHNSFSV